MKMDDGWRLVFLCYQLYEMSHNDSNAARVANGSRARNEFTF